MKVVAFNSSPRPDGNTTLLLKTVLEVLEKDGIDTELIQIKRPINPCTACYKCTVNKDRKCIQTDDMMNTYIKKMVEAQGIIIGSPTYFGDITPELRAFIDRTGMVCRTNGDLLARKVGAAVISVRRGGAVHAFMSANNMFFLNQMVIPCSRYWNFAFGPQKGKVLEDEEGMDTMRTLGRNMAWTMKKLHG